jgi:hypothetical protein
MESQFQPSISTGVILLGCESEPQITGCSSKPEIGRCDEYSNSSHNFLIGFSSNNGLSGRELKMSGITHHPDRGVLPVKSTMVLPAGPSTLSRIALESLLRLGKSPETAVFPGFVNFHTSLKFPAEDVHFLSLCSSFDCPNICGLVCSFKMSNLGS